MFPNQKIKLRVILPGGGVKGSFQLGVLSEILNSNKFEIDSVYGCSIGAILAPSLANSDITSSINIFNNIKSITDVMEPWKFLGISISNKTLLGFLSFLKMGAYKSVKITNEVFNSLSPVQIKIAQEHCHVVAYDIVNNTETWFTGDELEMGIKCSSALWLAVPPISYKDNLYCDGGVTQLFPVDYIINHDSRTNFDGVYLFVDCDSRKPYKNVTPTDALTLMNELQLASSIRLAQFELAKLQQELNNLIIIRPDVNILTSPLDINQDRMKETFDAGVLKGQEFVENYN